MANLNRINYLLICFLLALIVRNHIRYLKWRLGCDENPQNIKKK